MGTVACAQIVPVAPVWRLPVRKEASEVVVVVVVRRRHSNSCQ